MDKKNVTIYFYELQFGLFTGNQNPDGTMNIKNQDINLFKSELTDVLNSNLNDYSALTFGNEDKLSIEIINRGTNISIIKNLKECPMDENIRYIFGKIGKEKNIMNYQRRNKTTLQTKDLEKDNDEIFESFTYFYLFFENLDSKKVATIAFLNFESAPGIRQLKLITTLMSENYEINIEPIVSADCIALIMSKKTINTISYSVSLPPDDILSSDIFGLNEKDFDELRNLKSLNLSLELKGDRNKNVFNDKKTIKKLFDNLSMFTKKRKGDSFTLSSKAKNENERMLEYSFMDNKFISKAIIKFEDDLTWQKEIEQTMHNKYMEMRKELLRSLKG